MGRSKISEDQRRELVKLYADGIKTKDLAAAYGITITRVTEIARMAGVHRHKHGGVSNEKQCSYCFAYNPQKARYCMFCGGDVRSERNLAFESLARLRDLIALLPENTRGEADEETRRIMRYLEGIKT